MNAVTTSLPNNLSQVLVALMKGVMDRENDLARWQSLLDLQTRVRDHVAILGLELILDEAEGYAYLRQRPVQEGRDVSSVIRSVYCSHYCGKSSLSSMQSAESPVSYSAETG